MKDSFNRGLIIFIAMALCMVPMIAVANSMEPPGLVLIVPGNYDDLDVEILYEGDRVHTSPKEWPMETQYWFFNYGGYQNKLASTIHVQWEGNDRSFALPASERYHVTYTVDLKNNELIKGKTLMRSMILVGSRVLLTLLIEGLVFWLIGFRRLKSWLVFLGMNLISQVCLNLYINSLDVAASYPMFALVFGEFWVFLVEIILCLILIREHSKGRRIGYAILANGASLVLGGFLLTWLPV